MSARTRVARGAALLPPPCRRSSASASSRSKASSSKRTSRSSPLALSLPSGSGGSLRVATTSCAPSGRFSSTSSTCAQASCFCTSWASSSTSTNGRRAGHRRREPGQDPLDQRRAAQLQQLEDLGIDAEHLVQRDGQAAQQHEGVVVVAVEPQPDRRPALGAQPLRERHRLARAGRRRHQHQRLGGLQQRRDQRLARDELDVRPRRAQLRGEASERGTPCAGRSALRVTLRQHVVKAHSQPPHHRSSWSSPVLATACIHDIRGLVGEKARPVGCKVTGQRSQGMPRCRQKAGWRRLARAARSSDHWRPRARSGERVDGPPWSSSSHRRSLQRALGWCARAPGGARGQPRIRRCGSTSSRRIRSSSAVGGTVTVDREQSRAKPVFSCTCSGVTPS